MFTITHNCYVKLLLLLISFIWLQNLRDSQAFQLKWWPSVYKSLASKLTRSPLIIYSLPFIIQLHVIVLFKWSHIQWRWLYSHKGYTYTYVGARDVAQWQSTCVAFLPKILRIFKYCILEITESTPATSA